MIRLYINQHEIDLYEHEPIGYTKKVHDLKNLATIDSNFTRIFKVPGFGETGSERNVSFFQGLGITGSRSPMPYQKNTVRLFLDNTCIIYTGWAIFDEVTEDYEIAVYDGNIDFFKLLDNSNFEDINLPELSHTKDVATIKANWEAGNEFYKYLVADFNGETHFDEAGVNYINADYLVPSVPVKYLWERIFQTFGFTFSGSIFLEEEFNNLFLTYPKGVTSGEVAEPVYTLNYPLTTVFAYISHPVWLLGPYWEYEHEFTAGDIISNEHSDQWKTYQVPEDGFYKIATTGIIYARAKKNHDSLFFYGINLHTVPLDQITEDRLVPIAGGSGEVSLERIMTAELLAGDTITFFYHKERAEDVNYDKSEIQFNAEISKLNQTSIDQVEFFKGLTPKDFYKEILWRFGLVPFPSKDQNHIDFLTWEERINGNPENWSNKFKRKLSEKYVYDGYGKNNYFRFKYNGEGDDFNDGVIFIENQNLKDKTDVINSKTYSVERLPVVFNIGLLPESLPKIELWQKEVKNENGQTVIDYKPRDSRFSFVREKELVKSVNLGSRELDQYSTATRIKVIDRYNYSWQKIINDRYKSIKSLFKNTLILKAEFILSESEFNSFDLKPTIYVEQLGGTFLVNKIEKKNLLDNSSIAELIKINN